MKTYIILKTDILYDITISGNKSQLCCSDVCTLKVK